MTWLLRFDQEVFRFLHVDLANPVLGAVMWLFSYSGLGQVQAIFALLLLTKRETKYYTLPLLVTIIFSGLIVAQAIKRLLERERPSLLEIATPFEPWEHNSFPSGHTTTSFAVATMLVLMTYGSRNSWIGKAALVWAFLVGVSRIYRGVHWPTDVLAGAFAGMFSAGIVYLVLRKLGKQLHLDHPSATISGAEVGR